MRYLFFFMAEWGNLFIMGAIMTTLYFGGWQFPQVTDNRVAMNLLQLGTFNVKVLTFVFVAMWIRGTLPRVRIDQMMSLCWKYFVPISFLCIIGTAVWVVVFPDGAPIVPWVLFALALLILGVFIQRVSHYARRSRMELYFKPTI
jgi:NADH-quinone oxidoreductase subunit H